MTELDVRSARPDQLVSSEKGKWEIIVGLEVHAQVTSNAKLFSGASAAYGGEPNAHVSLVDAAMRRRFWRYGSVRKRKEIKGLAPYA